MSWRKRTVWEWIGIGVAAFIGLLLLAIASAIPLSARALREKVILTLSADLDSQVELQSIRLRVLPHLHVVGAGLVIRHHARYDVPPLITIRSFVVDANLHDVFQHRITRLVLDGLDIQIPPDHHFREDNAVPTSGQSSTTAAGQTTTSSVMVDELVTTDARLSLLPGKPGKGPKVWSIHRLRMENVGVDQAMPFRATLTNAVPPGSIETSGTFGPWRSDRPGLTPLDGRFTFDHADLAVFKGVSGMLSAHGAFGGSLERIDIRGETDTPDFTVALGGHPVRLRAAYHTVVDGTNGNTMLERIDASFLETTIVARGAVVDTPGVHGRTVRLDLTIDRGRIQDVLQLAVPAAKPPMEGSLKLRTAFVLPPGESDVPSRLQLDGQFAMERVRFTSLDVQEKINELSHRSEGRPTAPATSSVLSDFGGRFRLKKSALTLPSVTFTVPGAAVQLAGTYKLRPQTLDFHGTLVMDAKISQTTTGFKHILLKLIDPVFRHGRGSALPITITGRRQNPSFGLDRGRIFHR